MTKSGSAIGRLASKVSLPFAGVATGYVLGTKIPFGSGGLVSIFVAAIFFAALYELREASATRRSEEVGSRQNQSDQ